MSLHMVVRMKFLGQRIEVLSDLIAGGFCGYGEKLIIRSSFSQFQQLFDFAFKGQLRVAPRTRIYRMALLRPHG